MLQRAGRAARVAGEGAMVGVRGGFVSSGQLGRLPASRVLLVASSGAFLAFLDATIVNVAFPSIQESFDDASIGALSWVLNAYNIVFAAFLVVCGRLTDLIGRRRAYVAGIALFTVASAWCGFATSIDMLVVARVAQALGAALLVPASLALVVEAFSGDKRAHAIGLWGATAAAAAGLGPPLGGALVELGGWRWAFFVNVPFGIATLLATRGGLVESRAPGRRALPDLRGAALLAAALAVLNLGIVKAGDWGWLSSGVVGSFAATAVLSGLFVLSSRAHRSPLLDPALMRLPAFALGNVATVLAGFGFFAYLLTNVLWLQYIWDYSVLRAGLALVPGALVAAVVAGALAPLAQRHGYRYVVVPGALVWAAAYVWYHQQVGVEPAFWAEWMPGQVLSGIGVGATLPVLGSAALAAVPGGRYATASAVVSSARQFGGVLGIAILVVVVGTPTGTDAIVAFRDGWVLSIVAFVAVAVVSLPLGRIQPADDEEADEDGAVPLVHLPDPPPAHDTLDHEPGLGDVPMFAALPPASRAALAAIAHEVSVPGGAWLLREGDPPGSAYVVRRGRLEVSVGNRVMRELGPGAVLGELALLTGEPRSAGVRARRDSTLLEVPREAFSQLLDDEPAAAHAVLTQVAGQLRTAGAPQTIERPTPPLVIAVIGLHDGTHASQLAASLLARLRTHLTVVAPGVVDQQGLERAERGHDRVLLVADGDDSDWRDRCVRQADAVVLVASSDADPAALAARLPRGATMPDVVLVGPDPGAARRVEWVATTDAWQLTVIDDVTADGVRALADRLAGRSLGVVLAGGGARAFTHIGVLRELEEAGIRIDRLAGSSVGAIVAGGYALGLRGDALEEACYAEFVRRRPFSDWRLPTHSLARGRRTRAGLTRAYGGDTVIEGLPRQLQVVSTDLISRTRQVHRRGNLVTAVQASCRLPVLFAPMPVEDRLLVDGGVLDNLPVDLLTQRAEGPVLAVNVPMGGGSGRRRPGPPRVPTLGETLLRTMMIGSGGAVATAQERGAAVLTPTPRGVGLLEFHQMDRMVQSGRQAARALLDQGGIEALGLVTWPGVGSGAGDGLVPSRAEPVETVTEHPVA